MQKMIASMMRQVMIFATEDRRTKLFASLRSFVAGSVSQRIGNVGIKFLAIRKDHATFL
ncbi:hypothetical protein ACVDG5_004525 [Mesorhizobium sp. ORM6]